MGIQPAMICTPKGLNSPLEDRSSYVSPITRSRRLRARSMALGNQTECNFDVLGQPAVSEQSRKGQRPEIVYCVAAHI